MEKTIKVGVMPGRITEYVVEVGTTVQSVLDLADISASGYEVKVDSIKVDPNTAVVGENTNLILLVRQVKGNCEKEVRIGVMPGRIDTYMVEVGTTIQEAIDLAEISTSGYEVKVDSVKVDPHTAIVGENTNLILLVKMIKGNK